MRLAASIRYGGELVNAGEVDYNAYRHLGLVCPDCNDPVFLAAAHRRHLATGCVSQVPAQFRHFKASDPVLVQGCVARVARYDEKEIARRATVARHQRLKTLQRWFWSIFTSRADIFVEYLNDPATEADRIMSTPLIEPIRQTFLKCGEDDIGRILGFLTDDSEEYSEITDDRLLRDLKRLTQLDHRLHAAICREVLKFLLSRTSAHMFNRAILASVGLSYYGKESRKAIEGGADIRRVAYMKLIGLITIIPWADEFSAYEPF